MSLSDEQPAALNDDLSTPPPASFRSRLPRSVSAASNNFIGRTTRATVALGSTSSSRSYTEDFDMSPTLTSEIRDANESPATSRIDSHVGDVPVASAATTSVGSLPSAAANSTVLSPVVSADCDVDYTTPPCGKPVATRSRRSSASASSFSRGQSVRRKSLVAGFTDVSKRSPANESAVSPASLSPTETTAQSVGQDEHPTSPSTPHSKSKLPFSSLHAISSYASQVKAAACAIDAVNSERTKVKLSLEAMDTVSAENVDLKQESKSATSPGIQCTKSDSLLEPSVALSQATVPMSVDKETGHSPVSITATLAASAAVSSLSNPVKQEVQHDAVTSLSNVRIVSSCIASFVSATCITPSASTIDNAITTTVDLIAVSNASKISPIAANNQTLLQHLKRPSAAPPPSTIDIKKLKLSPQLSGGDLFATSTPSSAETVNRKASPVTTSVPSTPASFASSSRPSAVDRTTPSGFATTSSITSHHSSLLPGVVCTL